jgi:hypothetical protein
MTDLKYDVESTMLNVTIPTITPVTDPVSNKVIYNWTPPEPLPEPEEASFNTDGTSCTDSQWFDDESIREIMYRADVDPTVSLQALQLELEFDGETTRYEIVEDFSPHSSTPTCSSVQTDPHGTKVPMPDTPISICTHRHLKKLDKYDEKDECIASMHEEYNALDKRRCW